MKKLIAVALFFTAMKMIGQAGLTDSTQLNLKTNGGLAGDTSNALYVVPKRSTTAPASPLPGMLWCDTNFTPCLLKVYDGSAWNASATVSTVTTQTDLSAGFPVSPTDGQIVFIKSNSFFWIYNSSTSTWCNNAGTCTSANITDNFTGGVIAVPGAPTAAAVGSGGSMTAGTHSYKVTCTNASGGETTGSVSSNVVTTVTSGSVNLTAIPTCTSATNRRLYRTDAGNSSDWKWVAQISDNTTTTLTDTLADGSAGQLIPKKNNSGPMSGWTMYNVSTSGGCGETGSSLACTTPNTAQINSTAADTIARTAIDISAYNTGNYTIMYRVVNVGLTAIDSGGKAPCLGGLRVGNADNGIRYGTGISINIVTPLVVNVLMSSITRSTIGGSASDTTGTGAFPLVAAVPFWIKFVKFGSSYSFFVSTNARDWSPGLPATGFQPTVNTPSSQYTQFELQMCSSNAALRNYVEIDNFTLTVN